MTSPTFFTVVADYKSVVVDLASDVDYDPQLGPVTATVTFRPVLRNGDVILATNASPRPTGYVAAPIRARIDTDGKLKLRVEPDGDRDDFATLAAFPPSGNTAKVYFAIDTQTFYKWNGSTYVATYPYTPVRLLADTPLLELDSPLFYTVTFTDVAYNGQPGIIAPFTFQAPTADIELNLIEVSRQPGQPPTPITKIAPGAVRVVDGNKLQFSFAGVDIPEAVDINVTADVIEDSGATGRALVRAANQAAAWTALGVAPAQNLPSYVDDVLEYANQAAFPATGETGKIYLALDTGDSFRWTGSTYLRISDRVLAAGITDSTATGRSVLTGDAAAGRTALAAVGKGELLHNVKDYGAAGDGVADDTAEIHAARDAAGAGGALFFPKGTYLVDGLTASVANQSWQLHPGAVIKMKTGASEVLDITGDGVIVTGGTFDCSNGTLSDWSQQGILVSGDNVTLRNTAVIDSPKIGVYAQNCNGFTVTGCTFTDCQYSAIFVQNTLTGPSNIADIAITDNTVVGTSQDANGIYVRGESATQTLSRVKISRNTVRLPYNQTGVTGAVIFHNGNDWSVDNNLLIGGWAGITTPDPQRAAISNNVIRGFYSIGIEIPGRVDHVAITGNLIDADGVDAGSGIQTSANTVENLTIVGNTIGGFPAGPSYGVLFGSGSALNAVTISANTITSAVASGQFNGIFANATAANVTITGNIIDAASTATSQGIALLGTSTAGVAVTGNQFSNIAATVLNLSTANAGTFSDVRFTGNIVRNCGTALGGAGATAGTNIVSDSAAAAVNTMALRDGNANLTADAFLPTLASTATAAGTTTLTVDSAEVQRFTGSTTQTCTLPTTSVTAGRRFTIINNSTGAVTVNASGGAAVIVIAAGSTAAVTALQAAPTTAAHWAVNVSSVNGYTGNVTLAKSDVGLGSVDNTADATKNVLSATKLNTPRTISGVSFDGSANIDVVSAATVGQHYFPPGYVSGNYYYCNSGVQTTTSSALGVGTARASLWIVTAPITITRLFAEFTAAGDAASVFRIGIWNHDTATGKPGSLVLDAGTISTGSGNAGTVATGGTPGVYEITVSQALSAGAYWVGGAVQGVTTTQPTMRCIQTTTVPLFYPIGTSLPSGGGTSLGFALTSQTGAFGSLAGASNGQGAPARIGFKVS